MRVRFQQRVTREIDGEWTDLVVEVTADVDRDGADLDDVTLDGEGFSLTSEEEGHAADLASNAAYWDYVDALERRRD